MEKNTSYKITNNKKLKKLNNGKYYTEEQKEIRKFVIILAILFLIIGIIFFVTDRFVKEGPQTNSIPGEINYDIASVGTMLNRPYNEYYVILYSSKNVNSSYYSSIINSYNTKHSKEDNYKKIYYVNINNNLNKDYYNVNEDNVSNPKAKTIEELDLGDLTLLEVKNNKIVSYNESINGIVKILE